MAGTLWMAGFAAFCVLEHKVFIIVIIFAAYLFFWLDLFAFAIWDAVRLVAFCLTHIDYLTVFLANDELWILA